VLRSAYIETSVVSYLTARRNQRDLIVAAHQELTREWWESRRQDFTLFASAVVIEEALRGDEMFANARMALIEQMRLADVTPAARQLAAQLLLEAVFRQRRTPTRFTLRYAPSTESITCSRGTVRILQMLR